MNSARSVRVVLARESHHESPCAAELARRRVEGEHQRRKRRLGEPIGDFVAEHGAFSGRAVALADDDENEGSAACVFRAEKCAELFLRLRRIVAMQVTRRRGSPAQRSPLLRGEPDARTFDAPLCLRENELGRRGAGLRDARRCARGRNATNALGEASRARGRHGIVALGPLGPLRGLGDFGTAQCFEGTVRGLAGHRSICSVLSEFV